MSNALAIATVTGVLAARIRAHLVGAGLTFEVTASHPLDADTHGAFVHLYSVLPSPGLRNETLPERRPDATTTLAPRLAIDLHYQLTFVGSTSSHEPERMAGAVMTGLHAFPVLSPSEITDFIAAQAAGSPLLAADLADQHEHIRVTLLAADIEELSRLWGMAQRSFHRLTVLYRVSPVLLDAQIPTSRPLPVTTPTVSTLLLRSPRITALTSSARALPVVELGDRIVITGQALRSEHTRIQVATEQLEPTDATDTELRLLLDPGSGLRCGIHPVQVCHHLELANGELREGPRSNTVPVALVPRVPQDSLVANAVGGGTSPGHEIHLVAEPMPSPGQDVALVITAAGGGERHTSTTWRTEADGSGETLLIFDFPTLAAGDYLVRLVVDGAESLLTTSSTGAFSGPSVTVP